MIYSLWISVFWAFKELFQKRIRSLDEAESTRKIIAVSWNKAASMDIDVSVLESTSIYPSNRNRVPEYFFSISDTSETVTFMETAPPDMAPICAPSASGIDSQNIFPISAGHSLNTLNTTFHSDISPEEVTSFILFNISPVPKIAWKCSIS
jgi:hypothetical protein